ncbi:MAG: FGGY family carbohydrate kinase [Spirochaetia bacterium]|jgi:xylulokinase
MSFLGLDVGTTGCKAVAVNSEGRVIAQSYHDYPLVSPKPGWSELDSTRLWTSIKEVIAQTSRQAGSDPIKAMSISSQGEAVAPVGRDGATLGNFIVTFDSRTEAQCGWWEKGLGRKALFDVTGMPLHPMYSINKIMWVKENCPQVYSKAWKFLCIEDFVIFKLSGAAVIDYSLAARTMCFDIIRKKWADRILSRADVDPALLSEPRPSGYAVGTVSNRMAEELGLGKDTIVATGGHDQPCGALGAGAVRPGMVMNAIGTSDVLCPTLAKPVLTARMLKSNYCCYPHVIGDAYTTITFNLTGGLLLRWYRDTLCAEEVQEAERTHADAYEIIIGRASAQPADLYILPHFVGSGTPTLDPRSRGAIVGLTLHTTKSEISRALLDSNNYDLRLNLDTLRGIGIPIEELRVIGGGSKSAAWIQMRADVLGKPVSVPTTLEAASLGAAILAAASVGHFPTAQAGAQAWVKVARTFEPDARMREIYELKYGNYLKLYPSLKDAGIRY